MGADETPPEEPTATGEPTTDQTAIAPHSNIPEDVAAMMKPLIAQVQEWTRQLEPFVAQTGTAVQTAVAPVAAALQTWAAEHVEPLVQRGGEEVRKAVAPALEALKALLARLEPYLTSISTAVQAAVQPAFDAVKQLLEHLQPLVLNAAVELRKNSSAAALALAEWNKTQLQPWAAQTGQAIKVSSVAAFENAKVQTLAAGAAVQEWNTTQLQPWAAQTGEQLKTHAINTAANVQQWNETQFQPWIANTAAPTAQKWWQEALICFCVPLAGVVAMAGLKDQAAKLQALAPEKAIEEGPFPSAVATA